MTAIGAASQEASSVSHRQDCPERNCHRHLRPKRDVPLNGSGQKAATATGARPGDRSLSVLLAELVELGREAWRIHERERAVRAEIEALRKVEESKG